MSDHPAPGGSPSGAEPEFDERLTVPLWWWPLGLGVAALLAAEVHMGYPGVRAWLPYLLTVPLAAAFLVRMGRRRVQVRDGELHVSPAHIPLRHLGSVEVIPATAKRRVLGPELDPTAFVSHSAWVKPVIRVQITDPDDPTPYWVFSVRRADELAELLQRSQPDLRNDDSGRR
ncbi:MAG TPA: DUF3093 domain-containing protein [Pseudonocardiaceae bacterium]|jgi:hypothetical protein